MGLGLGLRPEGRLSRRRCVSARVRGRGRGRGRVGVRPGGRLSRSWVSAQRSPEHSEATSSSVKPRSETPGGARGGAAGGEAPWEDGHGSVARRRTMRCACSASTSSPRAAPTTWVTAPCSSSASFASVSSTEARAMPTTMRRTTAPSDRLKRCRPSNTEKQSTHIGTLDLVRAWVRVRVSVRVRDEG